VPPEYDASHREVVDSIEAMSDDELASEEVYVAIGGNTFRHYPEYAAMLTTQLQEYP
jgi:hypothetical protein